MTPTWTPGESVIEMVDGLETPPLFDVEPDQVKPEAPKLGPDARRTAKQQLRVDYGYNPLKNTPVHPQAPRDASAADLHPREYTCGTCVFAKHVTSGGDLGGKPRVSLKCHSDTGRWLTLGPATTIRRWWPGCSQWAPRPS